MRYFVPALFLALLLTGCDATGGDDEPAIEGFWIEIDPEFGVFGLDRLLEITPDSVADYLHHREEDCYLGITLAILEVEGSLYTIGLTPPSGVPGLPDSGGLEVKNQYRFVLDGDVLNVTQIIDAPGGETREELAQMRRSTAPPASYRPECPLEVILPGFPGDDD